MSLSSKTELARALFRTPSPDSVTRISGTATADSADGTVTVQLEDGDVIEVGTIGSVSAGDTVTIHVQRGEAQVIASEGWGDAMQAAVDEAQAIAEATGQHFWHDSNGAHVTEITQEQWAQSQTGHNILVNSLGILLRKALNYIAAWTGSALSFYDGDGNAASNVTASFGSAGAQIGKVDESHLEMDYHSMRMVAFDGTEYFRVADVRDYDGTITATVVGDGVTTQWALPSGNVYSWHFSAQVLDEHGNPPGISYSFAVIQGSTTFSYIFQVTPVMAAGYTCTVTFRDITAPSPYLTFGTRGSGDAGFTSATFGYNLVATSACSLVTGTYNVPDENGEHAVIVGNGINQSARSNALTVDWSGNVEAAGDVRAGGSTPLVPIGTILDFAAATAPTGYLVCDGSAVSRSTYAALFAVIGTTWGSGNGSTTFNVPDFRGRTAIGAGTGTASDATAHALASKGGTETHTLTSAQSGVPAHNHPLPNSAIVYNADGTQRLATSGSGTKSSVNTSVGLSTASNTAANASSAHPNMQPYAAVTKIIRAI